MKYSEGNPNLIKSGKISLPSMDFFLAREKTDSIEHLLSHTQLLCFPFKLKIYFLFRKLLFFLLTGSTLMKCVSLLTIYCKKW